jgi:hypothetical protein
MESRLGGSYLRDMQIQYSNYTLIYKYLCWSDIMESRLGGSYLTDMQIHYSNYTLIYKELYWSDIMESRLGGSYLTDMQQLRDQHKNLKEIVDFFLAKASPEYV